MDEVQLGDEVVVYYDGMKYTYQVSDIKVVSPDATGFYTGVAPVATLRMQFCAPPQGSLERRTLVDALLISSEPLTNVSI
jgi:sortase (surface protein transpeptidase)